MCFICAFIGNIARMLEECFTSNLQWEDSQFFFGSTDVTQPLLVEVDQIYHLACPASPIFYKHNAVKVTLLVCCTLLW